MAPVDLAHDDAGDGPVVVLIHGHLPNLERPDAFNEHLLRFLTRALP
jgi:hypothetical protein